MKTIIDVIEVTDADAIMKQQTKINQWRTLGIFVDMQIVATDKHIVFTITRFKELPEPIEVKASDKPKVYKDPFDIDPPF